MATDPLYEIKITLKNGKEVFGLYDRVDARDVMDDLQASVDSVSARSPYGNLTYTLHDARDFEASVLISEIAALEMQEKK